MTIEKIRSNEDFMRGYKLAKKREINYGEYDDKYEKIRSLCKDSIIKLHKTEYIPKKDLLYTRNQAFDYLIDSIRTNWGVDNLNKDKSICAVDIAEFEHKLDLLSDYNVMEEIAKLTTCDNAMFLKLINVDVNNFRSDPKYNMLLKIFCIPIGNKYLINEVYDNTRKYDYIILQEKIFSVIPQLRISCNDLRMLYINYLAASSKIAEILPVKFDPNSSKSSISDFMRDNIYELLTIIEEDKNNFYYKKQLYLLKLNTEMELLNSKGNQNYDNVFEVDLNRQIDTSFYKELDYSYIRNFVKDLILEDLLGNFHEKLAEVEKTFVYYCLFISVYAANSYKATIQIGEYLLEDNKLYKYRDYITRNISYIHIKPNVDALLKRYDTDIQSDFYYKLIDAYVKEKRFKSALSVLKNENSASSHSIKLILNKEGKDKDIYLKILPKQLKDDIVISKYDLFFVDEESVISAIKQWIEESFTDSNFIEVKYKHIEKHLINIIMITYINGEKKLTKVLLEEFIKYFKNSKDEIDQLYEFIILNLEEQTQIDRELLDLLKNAESELFRISNNKHNTKDVEKALVKVKKIYENAGTVLNDHLTNQKMMALSSILKHKLDENTYNELIDDVINEMRNQLDASNLKTEEIYNYYEILSESNLLGKIWNKLEIDTKTNLATGMYLFDTQNAFFMNITTDYSATILNWCLAIENELRLKLYMPFFEYCDHKGIILEGVNRDKDTTFGTYLYIFGDSANRGDKEYFLDFCETIYPSLKRNEIRKLMSINIKEKLNIARKSYRNKAAHPEILDEEVANSCYDLFFPTKHLLRTLLADYENSKTDE